MRHHRRGAALALALVSGGCTVFRSSPREAAGSLRVTVIAEETVLQTFVATDIRPRHRAAYPSGSIPVAGTTGGGMVAFSSGKRDRTSMLFVLEEGGPADQGPSITVFPVSYSPDGERGTLIPNPAFKARSVPPCMSWSGFFIKGIGDSPGVPVVLHFWRNEGLAGSIWIDPALHTMSLQPVLRFSTRDVKALRNRKVEYLFSVTATVGARPFLILGLVRRPDGSYTEALFPPVGEQQGWSAFIHTPGEVTEISFYALDDPLILRSACRGPHPGMHRDSANGNGSTAAQSP